MLLRNFITGKSGATAIEYALIAGLIAIGLVLGLRLLSDNLGASVNNTSQKIENATE